MPSEPRQEPTANRDEVSTASGPGSPRGQPAWVVEATGSLRFALRFGNDETRSRSAPGTDLINPITHNCAIISAGFQ